MGLLQPSDFLQNEFELFLWCTAVVTAVGNAGTHLTRKAGNAHHEEFVEIGRGNGQETQAFEQRLMRVMRLLRARAD